MIDAYVPPPPKITVLAPRIAEVVALRLIVMNLVTATALQSERNGFGTRQAYINMVAEACERALFSPDVAKDDTEQATQIKREALQEVNAIIGNLFEADISTAN